MDFEEPALEQEVSDFALTEDSGFFDPAAGSVQWR